MNVKTIQIVKQWKNPGISKTHKDSYIMLYNNSYIKRQWQKIETS